MARSVAAPTRQRQRLPFVVPLLTLGVFLMITIEYIVAGLLQEVAADLHVSIAQVGFLITAFAVGMIIGSPVMAIATLRLPPRMTLVLALVVYAVAHVAAALSGSFTFVLISRVSLRALFTVRCLNWPPCRIPQPRPTDRMPHDRGTVFAGSRVAAFSTWLAARQPPPSSGVPQGKNRHEQPFMQVDGCPRGCTLGSGKEHSRV